MSTPEEQTNTMIQNLADKTGKTLDEWIQIVRDSRIEKHKEILNFLQTEHGFTYGFANLVALKAREAASAAAGAPPASGDGLIDEQYAGAKASLRPIYDKLIQAALGFGSDVEISPKKAYVSLRRSKQFAILQPSSATRFDLGLVLKGVHPAGRLEASGNWNAMCSHRVKVGSLAEVDAELLAWFKQSYEGA